MRDKKPAGPLPEEQWPTLTSVFFFNFFSEKEDE